MKRLAVLMVCLCSLSLQAGYTYLAESTSQEEGKRKVDTTIVQAYVEGDMVRIEFREAGSNPMAKEGTWLLSKDGGKTIFLVNPKDKNYMSWNMQQMGQLAGAMGGMFNMQFTNTKVEKLEESSGDKILGYATRRYKFKTSYDLDMKIMGMRQSQSIETIQEAWNTTAISDEGMKMWLRNMPTTGIEGLDEMIETSTKMVKGFPLRTKARTTTRQYNRKRTKVKRESTTISEMVVKELKKEKVDSSMFEIPSDYQKIEMPTEGDNGNGMPSFKSIFKKNQ